MQRPIGHIRAFTLIEILVTIGILLVLSALLLPAISGIRRSAAETQTFNLIETISRSIRVYNQTEQTALHPDGTCFIDWDPTIDPQDVGSIGTFATWPVLNKLDLKLAPRIDRQRLIATNGTRRLCDYWDQEIRFVPADGPDDNGHQPQGSRDHWNWNAAKSEPLTADFSYVYSYGADNSEGDDTEAWIVNEERD